MLHSVFFSSFEKLQCIFNFYIDLNTVHINSCAWLCRGHFLLTFRRDGIFIGEFIENFDSRLCMVHLRYTCLLWCVNNKNIDFASFFYVHMHIFNLYNSFWVYIFHKFALIMDSNVFFFYLTAYWNHWHDWLNWIW